MRCLHGRSHHTLWAEYTEALVKLGRCYKRPLFDFRLDNSLVTVYWLPWKLVDILVTSQT